MNAKKISVDFYRRCIDIIVILLILEGPLLGETAVFKIKLKFRSKNFNDHLMPGTKNLVACLDCWGIRSNTAKEPF